MTISSSLDAIGGLAAIFSFSLPFLSAMAACNASVAVATCGWFQPIYKIL
jgi:hypothetical protein